MCPFQHLFSQDLNELRESAVTTSDGRSFHPSTTLLLKKCPLTLRRYRFVRSGSAEVFSLIISESGVDQLILLHHSGSITQKGVLETDKRMHDRRTTSFKNIHNDMKYCSIKHTCHKY